MTPRLMFYVNPLWRREGIHSPFMNPWWGNPYDGTVTFAKRMFDTYCFDTSLYGITDLIEKADLVFPPYPHTWFLRNDPALFDECVTIAHQRGLPLLVDGTGDFDYPIKASNVFILRYGGYRFLPEQGRIQVPLFADDLLERYKGGILDVRKKNPGKPVVAFAGWASLSPTQQVRSFIRQLPVRLRSLTDGRYRTCIKGIFWRQKAIRRLHTSSGVCVNLRNRKTFSGSTKTAIGDLITLQKEMVDTILTSDYSLDVRGDANNSTRLFEILSLGRIPVIVDTERIFPFSNKIDYSEFALTIDYRDINRIGEIIADFHMKIAPDRFEQMQRRAREVFVQYFRPDALIRPLIEELQRKMSLTPVFNASPQQ